MDKVKKNSQIVTHDHQKPTDFFNNISAFSCSQELVQNFKQFYMCEITETIFVSRRRLEIYNTYAKRNESLHTVYFFPNNIVIIVSGRLRWSRLVASKRKLRHVKV